MDFRTRNPYRTALGLEDMDLAAFVSSSQTTGRSSIMAALVEHGAPLAIEAIAERLHGLGMGESEEALLRSLRKAWGASDALRKLKDGRLWLDVNAPDAQFLRVTVSLATKALPPPTPEPDTPPPSAPLGEEELEGFPDGFDFSGYSGAQLAAIVTEVIGCAMSAMDINAYLAGHTDKFHPLAEPPLATARSPLVSMDDKQCLIVQSDATGLPALRARFRKALRREMARAFFAEVIEERREARELEDFVRKAEVLTRRRRLIHLFEIDGTHILAGHLDPSTDDSPEFVGTPQLHEASWVPDCDVLIGLDVFDVIDRLGMEIGGRRLVDLGPPQKTKSVGAGLPPLKLTTDRLLRNSLGGWARLHSTSKIRTLARKRDPKALHAAMEADLDVLTTYYWYGVHQRVLDSIWRDGSMEVQSTFAEFEDPSIVEILEGLVGQAVWVRLRGDRMSDAPEDFVGEITRLSWDWFEMNGPGFTLRSSTRNVIAIRKI